jgi:hypothetical protein
VITFIKYRAMVLEDHCERRCEEPLDFGSTEATSRPHQARTDTIFNPAGFAPIEKLAAVPYGELKNIFKSLIAISNS